MLCPRAAARIIGGLAATSTVPMTTPTTIIAAAAIPRRDSII
jgi:hypothetical protein